MSEDISGSISERYRHLTERAPSGFRDLSEAGETIRSSDGANGYREFVASGGFSPAERDALRQLGIPNDRNTAFFPPGRVGADQYIQFVETVTSGDFNRIPRYLANHPGERGSHFEARIEEYRRDYVLAGTTMFLGTVASGAAQVAGARAPGGCNRMPGNNMDGRAGGNDGPRGPGGSSGPYRGGGGGGAPRGPHGGGVGVAQQLEQQLPGLSNQPAANFITPTRGQFRSAAPQPSLVQQPATSPLAVAAGQIAFGNQREVQPPPQTQTEAPGLIPEGFPGAGASGVTVSGRRPEPDVTVGDTDGRRTGRESRVPDTDQHFGLSDMPRGTPLSQQPVYSPDTSSLQNPEMQALRDQHIRGVEERATAREQTRAGQAPPARHDFQNARDVVDSLPDMLGPEGFAEYEKIMSDPIRRSALEEQAHNPRFLGFVQSIIAGNIDPQVATNRLRNDDPDTVGAPPITGLSRGRDWDVPDVERMLRPNEQDAFRRYAEAFPDVAQIVFEAGYDASAGQMRDALRALLNGAYGQDVAASLRSGGLAGGRGGPPFNTGPYTGTGGEFVDPENTSDTQQAGRAEERRRIIVPGAANDQKIHLPDAIGETDDTAQSAPSIIIPGMIGPDEPRIWTPGEAYQPMKTEEELRRLAQQSRQYREENGEPIGNTLLALFNNTFGQAPTTICDIHSHEGVCDPRTLERQAGRPGYSPGYGSYDPDFRGDPPAGLTPEQEADWLVDRLITQAQEMGGGQTVFFPVAPRFGSETTSSALQDEDEAQQDGGAAQRRRTQRYYLSRDENGKTILGVLQINRGENTVSTDQMISGPDGNPVLAPFTLSIGEFEELTGHSIPRGVDTIEFVSASAGCELHFSGTDVDEGLADNFASIIRHENEIRGTNYVAEHYVLGLTSGNPREEGSFKNIYRSLNELNRAEKDYGLQPGTIKALWGETNLSKEIVHSLGGQTPLVYNTPEEKANLTRWAQAMGETGMPVVIHCDSGTAAETNRLNTTGSLSALRLPSNNANVESFMEFANSAPDTTIIWSHGGGLGFTVQMPPDHLDQLRKVLEAAPNVVIDMSWDAIHPYIAEDPAGWARLIADHPTRFMFGSDTIATTQNPAPNSRRNVVESLVRTGLIRELDRIDLYLKEALFSENFNTHITPGLERATQFRLYPENAEWLENGAEGPPPSIWQRGPDGAYLDQMIRNPARGE